MTAWTEGYVADIPYALGFYRETVPAHVAFAAICVGKHPGLLLQPRRVLELGIGMGLGFVINAAANPDTHFEGVDFNPLHVAHARGLVDAAALDNVTLAEASFQDVARVAQDGQHDLDLIVLHGILTWVSAEAHAAIVEIARKRLRPGGMLYASYNCMPGWAPVLPLQRLMRENAKRVAGRSDLQTGAGLDLVKALMAEGAGYFSVNSGLTERVAKLDKMDRNYLAHEYLNANWFIFHFADVAEMFGGAKLDFVASATLAENMDSISQPTGVRPRLAAETDPVFRETLRDIAVNKQFRRDLFGRGIGSLNPAESAAVLGATRFSLAISRSKVKFKISTTLSELDCKPELYGAVADLLAERDASFAEIVALPVFGPNAWGTALEALALLVYDGQVFPLPSGTAFDPAPSQRLNRVLVEKALQGRIYSFLAAPAAGSGVQAPNTDLLMLGAVLANEASSVDALTDALVMRMDRLGIGWLAEGRIVTESGEKRSRAAAEARGFLEEKLPLWRRLGIL